MRLKRWIGALLFFLLLTAAAPVSRARAGGDDMADLPRITVDELILMVAKKKPVVIIDVRVLDSYSEKILGAWQIPYDQIESHLKEIPRNRLVVTYCACPSEATSGHALQTLAKHGYKNVRALKGGWEAWLRAAGKTEPKK